MSTAKLWMKKKLFRSLAVGLLTSALVFGFYAWVRVQPEEDGIAWPLRKVLQWNEKIGRVFFNPRKLSKEYEVSDAQMPRVNGLIGMDDDDEDYDPSTWTMDVQSGVRKFTVTMAELKTFQRVEVFTELRCIEGWSTVVHWGGIRLSEFLLKYNLVSSDIAGDPKKYSNLYIALSTPNEEYYVGIDMASALQPQTLLATHMNNLPLTLSHGAPLRLAIPVKYGIKSIKRIGHLRISSTPPADYWARRGYDWYAGH